MPIKVPDDVLWRWVGDEIVITNPATEVFFGLDGAGARMWELLAENGSVEETAATVAGEFDADPATIRADLDALAADLTRRGLLESDDSGKVAGLRKPASGARRTSRR
ncbi:MAG TPA: PqqD family protein [Candidatus Binataceae bacterium]|nr:PqqD family protein [Candidatus Binataceae bacterium]